MTGFPIALASLLTLSDRPISPWLPVCAVIKGRFQRFYGCGFKPYKYLGSGIRGPSQVLWGRES